ncbi:hypothetical protein ACHAPO_001605 [Fusarium lateritium]
MPTVQKWNSRSQAAIAAGQFVHCGNINFGTSKANFADSLSAQGFNNCIIYWPLQQNNYAHIGWCQLQFPDRATAIRARASLNGLDLRGRPMTTGPVIPEASIRRPTKNPSPVPALASQPTSPAVAPTEAPTSVLPDTAASGFLPASSVPALPLRRTASDIEKLLKSLKLLAYPESWHFKEQNPNAAAEAYVSHIASAHGAYETSIGSRGFVGEREGQSVLRSTPLPSSHPKNTPFLRTWIYIQKGQGGERIFKKIPIESLSEDVWTMDEPYNDTACMFASAIDTYRHMSGSDLQPGQTVLNDPTARSRVSQSPTLILNSEVPVDENSATSRSHIEVYPTPRAVGAGWGDYARLQHWQGHGRVVELDMVPERTFEKKVSEKVSTVPPPGTQSVTVDIDCKAFVSDSACPKTLREHKESTYNRRGHKKPTRERKVPLVGEIDGW